MNMHWLDWAILVGFATFVCLMGLGTRQYLKSVADFLSANRCAGKYMLGVADGIAGLGAITIIARFEMFYKAGFTAAWWEMMYLPVWMLIAVSGWIQYRYRQTRAMTMAQFFELRYSRSFRIYAGLMAFVAGTVNFGIFPAVGGRFFQYFCGLPAYPVHVIGFEVDLVYGAIMFVLLGISVTLTLLGGQIAVMVTDFIQGTFCNVFFVVVSLYLLLHFSWGQIGEAAQTTLADASIVNPRKTADTDNFTVWYFLIATFGNFFTFMAWQGNQGYFSAAKTPHEAKMGRVVGNTRPIIQALPLALLPICAYTFLHHADFSTGAQAARDALGTIPSEQLQSQLTVTVAITQILPVGLIGAFAAAMFAAFVSTHDTYLHAWGSIFIQDIVMPIRATLRGNARPMDPRSHLLLLRVSVCGVAVFIFLFSLLFNQQQDIYMYFALTGTVYLGWAGAAIVGGLYWKRGNTGGAWSAAVVGVVLAVAGWYATFFWPNCTAMAETLAPGSWASTLAWWPALGAKKCPADPQYLWGGTMVVTSLVYIVGSLIWGRGRAANMDRLLHRGKYAKLVKGEKADVPLRGIRALMPPKGSSLADKMLFVASYGYTLMFFSVFIIGTIYVVRAEPSDAAWLGFWKVYCWVMLSLTGMLTVWFAIGGFRDFRSMFRLLRTTERDDRDDGTVVDGSNLDDLDLMPPAD